MSWRLLEADTIRGMDCDATPGRAVFSGVRSLGTAKLLGADYRPVRRGVDHSGVAAVSGTVSLDVWRLCA